LTLFPYTTLFRSKNLKTQNPKKFKNTKPKKILKTQNPKKFKNTKSKKIIKAKKPKKIVRCKLKCRITTKSRGTHAQKQLSGNFKHIF
jgi:hypothetical protein